MRGADSFDDENEGGRGRGRGRRGASYLDDGDMDDDMRGFDENDASLDDGIERDSDDEEVMDEENHSISSYFPIGSLPATPGGEMEESELAMMNDVERFYEDLEQPGSIDLNMDDHDEVDKLLAEVFLESLKTGDYTYREQIEFPALRRVRLPKPRSMTQLHAFTQPPALIHSAADAPGAELAREAWGVIHKNYYYSDAAKYNIYEKIPKLYGMLIKDIAEQEAQEDGPDLALQPQFRKGHTYLLEEELANSLKGEVIKEDTTFKQADTDWTVQAVVDEDQL